MKTKNTARAGLVLVAGFGLVGGLLGCDASQYNLRSGLGADVSLQAVSGSGTHAGEPMEVGAEPMGVRSVESMDRSNWATTRFVVPVDGTAHSPDYAHRFELADSLPRERGEFPDALGSLRYESGVSTDELGEAVIAPAAAVVDAVLIVPRMFLDAPWAVRYSPSDRYERTPRGSVVSGMASEDEAAAAPEALPEGG